MDGVTYGMVLNPAGTERDFADSFADWLTSETGTRTIEVYQPESRPLYVLVLAAPDIELAAAPRGDITLGEALSLTHSGRWHVVNQKNRMNGLGSTPSFRAHKALPDWDHRFQVFHVLNPHPAFTQIEDVTDPFDPMRPPPMAPMELTQDDVDAIYAYVASLRPADLGKPVQAQ